ncbi:MAG: hypothetical protein AMS25_18920, partial [Gemmatimonas sp. SM23_52]
IYLPEQKVFVAAFSNNTGKNVSMAGSKLAALAIGDPYPEFEEIALDEEILERYVGVYQIDEETQRIVTVEDGQLYTQSDEVPVREAIDLDPAIYDDYVGVYELGPGFELTVTREDDKLMAQATGQGRVQLFPESETEFFIREIDAQITFVRGAAGIVDELILHQGGRDMPAVRNK